MPGGVRSALLKQGREHICRKLPEAFETTVKVAALFKSLFDQLQREVQVFGNFHSVFLGLVGPNGE